jgi:DNA-binding MarR family transcriptional regulator
MANPILLYEQRELRSASGNRFLSREAHILIYVSANDFSSMKDVQLATGLSTRGFYLIVKKLMDLNWVLVCDASDDRRKRLLTLTELGLKAVADMPI